jgi:hydrogenase-4 component E
VAFSVLIALFVFAVFVFRIRERFDSVDIEALDQARGDTR